MKNPNTYLSVGAFQFIYLSIYSEEINRDISIKKIKFIFF